MACNQGYDLEDKKCVYRECSCSNGKFASGKVCPSKGFEKCIECDAGFEIKDNIDGTHTCVKKECTCNGGIAATGTDCEISGTEVCLSCNEGYTFENGVCTFRVCVCPNGTPTKGLEC